MSGDNAELRTTLQHRLEDSKGHAERYASRVGDLAERVSDRLLGAAPLARVPDISPQLLNNHQQQHGALIAEVMRVRDVDLLDEVFTSIYVTMHHQGFPNDYFPLEYAAWREVIREQLDGPLATALDTLYHYLEQCHAGHAAAAQARCNHWLEHELAPPDTESAAFVNALLTGDDVRLLELSAQVLHNGRTLPWLMQHCLHPAMVEIGYRWQHGRVSVAEEHRATATAFKALSTAYSWLTPPRPTRGRCVVATVHSEFHELGAWMVAKTLELDGWNVLLLNHDSTAEEILTAARAEPTVFVALSVALVEHLQAARDAVAALRRGVSAAACPPVVIGGGAFASAASLARSIDADQHLASLDDLLDWSRALPLAA